MVPMKASAETAKNLDHATFAGGCFCCMEAPFDKLKGVVDLTVGSTGAGVASGES